MKKLLTPPLFRQAATIVCINAMIYGFRLQNYWAITGFVVVGMILGYMNGFCGGCAMWQPHVEAMDDIATRAIAQNEDLIREIQRRDEEGEEWKRADE